MLHESTITTSAGALRLTQSDGKGMPILMIHGTGSCRGVFGKQLDSPLAQQHRLIAVDLPGMARAMTLGIVAAIRSAA
jgi:pimeloyl-ACP methyl ester carboxylesterase